MANALRFNGKRLRLGGNNLLWSGATTPIDLVFRVKTDNAGVSDSFSFTIPTRPGYAYNYTVVWGDGNTDVGVTGDITHAYDTAGEKTIKIYGIFSQFYFNIGGDRLKLLSIDAWGDVQYSSNNNMERSFYGASNLYYIADGASWFNTIINGNYMFWLSQLISLPSDMTLSSLIAADSMFRQNNLALLPDGMTLESLTNGSSMFQQNQLTSLPDGMTLDNLTNGNNMFYINQLTSLPDGMTLSSLTSGGGMFWGNQLTSLPDGMTLSSLTNGNSMFRQNQLTSLPDGMTLSSLTSGFQMFLGNTINTERYSQLLIDMEASNPNNNVTFHGGNSKYNSSAVTARANLVARGWTITDGGLE